MIVQTVVEGVGEVQAIPVLFRRLAGVAGVHDLQIATPIRYSRHDIVAGLGAERAASLARSRGAVSLVVVFDADDDCPVEVARAVAEHFASAAPDLAIWVVVADREYEAWFLGAIDSLRGRRGILADVDSHADPESPRDAKGELTQRMDGSRAYLPRVDQPAFTALFAMDSAYRTCRSFRRMAKVFGELAGLPDGEWPPVEWIGGT